MPGKRDFMKSIILRILPVVFLTGLVFFFPYTVCGEQTVDIAGFKATLSGVTEESKGTAEVVYGKGSLDLTPVFGTGAVVIADQISIYSTGTVKITSSAETEINVGPYKAQIPPGDIVYKPDSGSKTLEIDVVFNARIADRNLKAYAVLTVTAECIHDTAIRLALPAGESSLFSIKNPGAEFILESGILKIRNADVGQWEYKGSIFLFNSRLDLKTLNLVVISGAESNLASVGFSTPAVSGHAEGTAAVGKMTLSLPRGLDFSSDKKTVLEISIPESELDVSEVMADAKPITLDKVGFENGIFRAEGSMDQSLTLKGTAYRLTRVEVTYEQGADGTGLLKTRYDGYSLDAINDSKDSGTSEPEPGEKTTIPGLVEIDSEGNITIAGAQ